MAVLLPEFHQKLLQVEEENSNIASMNPRVLWEKLFIQTLFEIKSQKPWYWVVDALDEADDPGEVISFLGKIRSKTSIRVFVSSRFGVKLDRDFESLRCVRS
jgi:hypothetical protein